MGITVCSDKKLIEVRRMAEGEIEGGQGVDCKRKGQIRGCGNSL